jgi:hypothetical protein
MAINKIITEKTLNYIETLYLYANLQDFLTHTSTAHDWLLDERKPNGRFISQQDVQKIYDSEKYTLMMSYVYDTLLHSAEHIGESNGRTWYKMANYRLGIMNFDLAKKSNQFNIEIQYEQSHLFSLGKELKGLELPFDGELKDYKIKRIDVTQIVKTPNDYLTNHGFISPYRTIAEFSNKGKTETIYLGNRKSGNVFRMYNKTIELKVDTKEKPINYKKIELFSKYFGDIESLYTFELEMHRKYLKPTFGIDTLEDLSKVYEAHKDIVGKIKIYEDNDHNKKLVAQNHRDRIDTLCFVEYEELKRMEKKKYKTSKSYMIDKAVTAYNRYEQSCDTPISEQGRLSIISEIVSKIVDSKDITILIEESDYTKSINEMREKHELLKRNQDDQLFKESNKSFAPIMLQTEKDVF